MNIYDFDKTIFYPDSSAVFYKYCLKKYPMKVCRTIPATAITALLYFFGRVDTKKLKEQLFSYLSCLPDIDKTVSDFWGINERRIGEWYLKQKRDDDLVISASPEFLLKPVCDKLGIKLIATKMNKSTGIIDGENCHDTEKVVRFRQLFSDEEAECFYSDSLSDTPMAEIAKASYLVKKGNILSWPKDIDT